MRMRLAWLAPTFPDCCYQISALAQITESTYKSTPKTFITQINRATNYTRSHPVAITFHQLDKATIKILGYADASFSNNLDLSSQLGFIILLSDKTDKIIPIVFKSYKSKRFCRSAMAAEVIAFSDLFDAAFTIKHDISLLLGQDVQLQLFTDNKSLFDVISKGSRTSERRLMLDVAAAREGFKVGDISNIGLVRSERNIADGLTKHMAQATLRNLIEFGIHVPEPVQWIITSVFREMNADFRAVNVYGCPIQPFIFLCHLNVRIQ